MSQRSRHIPHELPAVFPHYDGNPTDLTIEGMLSHLWLDWEASREEEPENVVMDVKPDGEELLKEGSSRFVNIKAPRNSCLLSLFYLDTCMFGRYNI